MKAKTIILVLLSFISSYTFSQEKGLQLNEAEYFEMQGLNVMVFQDIYPEGHQGGVGIIHHGERVATNGDLRLEPTPGQWQPIPKQQKRIVDKQNNIIKVNLTYPDSSRHMKGFNPINYPDLYFNYNVEVKAEGNSIRVTVDLDRPLSNEWSKKVGFNFELYPVAFFGKSWLMGGQQGIFPRQANGPVQIDKDGQMQPVALATGKKLIIAPESDAQRFSIESKGEILELLDGRNKHNNGWFVVRSLVKPGVQKGAIEWIITANTIKDWKYKPVIHTSQVGYHPAQSKVAVIETDTRDSFTQEMSLIRLSEDGATEVVYKEVPRNWGKFLRYQYYKFDFSSVKQEGMYIIQSGELKTLPFQISKTVYDRYVWQPVLEYFLPIQMCHMRVNEKYRVWHGLCHMDDALMAPVDTNHFDGYVQGPSTLTKYKPLEHVPGLNVGGWHDAGDDDLRVESQAGEIYILSLAYEAFNVNIDNTSINQKTRNVEIHQPDGKNDILQQIEHGALSVTQGYKMLGRLYRGIICPTLDQYVLMGDVANQTNNLIYNPSKPADIGVTGVANIIDDRLVFTEKNPSREFSTAAHLAAVARTLKGFNDSLATSSLEIAEALWLAEKTERSKGDQIHAAIELFLTTKKEIYKKFIIDSEAEITKNISRYGWIIGRAMPLLNNQKFTASINTAVTAYSRKIQEQEKETPFGVPYRPHIWGAGWGIQDFGVQQYYMHTAFPQHFSKEYMLSALNFVLGCHPGENTASFASGVGAKSATVAYGYNRADYSFIPGGVVSGTSLIRPDFPELKEFPYLWQQGEYVLGGGSSNFMFLVLAAQQILNK